MNELMYVSRSLTPLEDAQLESLAIIQVSRVRNRKLGVTGVLIHTGGHFVQILEGDASSLSIVMRSVANDCRHTDVRIVDEGPIRTRAFGNWAMAYLGSATYVQRYVDDLLVKDGPVDAAAAASMRHLLEQLVGEGEVH